METEDKAGDLSRNTLSDKNRPFEVRFFRSISYYYLLIHKSITKFNA